MTEDMILEVDIKGGTTRELKEVSMKGLGILERGDLQNWILKTPAMLGEGLMVIDHEFDQFKGNRDRVDILALDSSGRLVVVELKREDHGAYADLQALRYAAKLRGLTFADLVEIRRKALRRDKRPDSEVESAEKDLLAFLEVSDPADGDFGGDPRIILASPGFSLELTTTVLYLRDHDIDVSCVRLTAYDAGQDRVILVPDMIIPIPQADDYTAGVDVRNAPAAVRPTGHRTRRPRVFPYLVANSLVSDGDPLFLKYDLPAGVTFDQANDDFHGTVVVVPDGPPKIRWKRDNQDYNASPLAEMIFKKHRPDYKGGIAGPRHWGTAVDSLADIAWRHQEAKKASPDAARAKSDTELEEPASVPEDVGIVSYARAEATEGGSKHQT